MHRMFRNVLTSRCIVSDRLVEKCMARPKRSKWGQPAVWLKTWRAAELDRSSGFVDCRTCVESRTTGRLQRTGCLQLAGCLWLGLIVIMSAFTLVPLHASVIENHYKMKESMKTFNLSGMGCSANVLAVDIEQDLLVAHLDSYALLLCTENLTINSNYQGNDKMFMLTNCLFRVGGAALLLSNKPQDARRAKMQLLHAVQTNLAANDEAYSCIMVDEDNNGVYGTRLHPSLLHVTPKALRNNLAILGPKVLPLREPLHYAYNMLSIKLVKMKVEPYIPNFKLAFQHFCIHPGGRSVISGIEKSLKLSEYDLDASRMALFHFGNTFSSGVWYEIAYMEGKRRLKVGERVLLIALGLGFKCNTTVWEVVREMHPLERNYWDDCLQRYPCNTYKNYTDDFCDHWFRRLNPIKPISNDLDTTTT